MGETIRYGVRPAERRCLIYSTKRKKRTETLVRREKYYVRIVTLQLLNGRRHNHKMEKIKLNNADDNSNGNDTTTTQAENKDGYYGYNKNDTRRKKATQIQY